MQSSVNAVRALVVRAVVMGCLLVPGMVAAQTVRVGNVAGSPGSTVMVPITFEEGAEIVAGYQVRFTYNRDAFGVPTVAPGALGTCSANEATGVVTVIRDLFPPAPMTDETTCTLLFPIEPGTPFGNEPLTVFEALFGDLLGEEVEGTGVSGNVSVQAAVGTAPTLGYIAAPDADGTADGIVEVQLLPTTAGGSATSEIVIAAVGGVGPGRVDLTCGISAGFTITGGGAQTINAGSVPNPITLSCTPAAAPALGTLTCQETDSPSGNTRQRLWDLRCAGDALFVDGFE